MSKKPIAKKPKKKKQTAKKLNLGSGDVPLAGYDNIDLKTGQSAYPLTTENGSLDEIRASHILEHYGHKDVFKVVQHWVSKLKPGGILQLAVPDFKVIVDLYQKKEDDAVGHYLMGGQKDEDDFHKSVFDEDSLTEIMTQAGLVNITRWISDVNDCASLPVSLNLRGERSLSAEAALKNPPLGQKIVSRKLAAVMSMPRLMFTDNMTCLMRHVVAKNIPFQRSTGVFWGQCLTRLIEATIKNEIDYLITIDYDSWFTYDDLMALATQLELHPELDAIMPLQCKRENDSPLVGIKDPSGEDMKYIPMTYFENKAVVDAASGHFGLTVFRKSCFDKIKKPWFIPKPDANGSWHDGRLDEDIVFWQHFHEGGCRLGLATQVKVGHLELKIAYPGRMKDAWRPVYMCVQDAEKGIKPPEVL